MNKKTHLHLRLAVPTFALTSLLHAQSAPVPEPPVDKAPAAPIVPQAATQAEEDIVVLSPFVIEASTDTGYVSASTLAGSRLKTDFRDIASQVSVMTPELLQDLGSFDSDDAFAYSINTENGAEIAGTTTNFFGNGGTSNSAGNRTRGVGSATNTRNFFVTLIPTSFYNTGENGLTIASGPNAILFGLGNAGGIADTRLNRAKMNASKGNIKLSTDSEGSFRSSFDYNQVLKKNKVALRVAVLDSRKKFAQKPNFEDDRRVYGALAFQPMSRITTELFAEYVDRKANRPIYVLPKDRVTPWLNPAIGNHTPYAGAGPFLNPATGTPYTTGTPARNFIVGRAPDAIATLGNPALGLAFSPRNGYLGLNANDGSPVYTTGPGQDADIYFYRYTANVQTLGDVIQSGYGDAPVYTADGTLKDESIYPFQKHSIYGKTHPNYLISKALMSVTTVKLTNDLFLEVAGNYESQRQKSANMFFNIQAAVNIDPNAFRFNPRYIPANQIAAQSPNNNPTPANPATVFAPTTAQLTTADANAATNAPNTGSNPNLGRLYVEGQQQANFDERFIKELRASLAYEFNSKKYLSETMSKIISKQRLSVLLSYQENSSRGQEQRRLIQDKTPGTATTLAVAPNVIDQTGSKDSLTGNPQYMFRNNGNATTNRNFLVRQYIDPNDPNNRYASFNGLDPWGVWEFDDVGGGKFQTALSPTFAVNGNRTQNISKAFSWQGYFLKDKLVLTYGRRWDDVDYKAVVTDVASPRTGLFRDYRDVPWERYAPLPQFVNETKSAVIHPLSWLSMHYNESTNNEARPPTNHDITGDFYPTATGTGKDFGFSVEAFGFNLRFNRFETENNSVDAGNLGNNNLRAEAQTLEARYIELQRNRALAPGGTPFTDYYLKDADSDGFNPLDNTRTYYRVFNNLVAKGTEVELVGRFKKLDVRLSVSKQNSVRSNVGPNWVKYALDPVVHQRMAALQWYARNPATGIYEGVTGVGAGNVLQFQSANPTLPILTGWQNIRRADNNAKTMYAGWSDSLAPAAITTQGAEGQSNSAIREWRANANLGYNLTSSWRIGTSLRFREAALIGYYDKIVPVVDINGAPVLVPGSVTVSNPAGTPQLAAPFDLARPVYNDRAIYVDPFIAYKGKLSNGMSYNVQLNVSNVLGEDDILMIASASSDRNNLNPANPRYSYYGITDAQSVGTAYQVQDPRSYSLTFTLNF